VPPGDEYAAPPASKAHFDENHGFEVTAKSAVPLVLPTRIFFSRLANLSL
jgi:hypothetical protein